MEGEAIAERAASARRPGSRRRLGKRHRQLHGLGLGVGERVGLVVDRIAVATREQAACPRCARRSARRPRRWAAAVGESQASHRAARARRPRGPGYENAGWRWRTSPLPIIAVGNDRLDSTEHTLDTSDRLLRGVAFVVSACINVAGPHHRSHARRRTAASGRCDRPGHA